MQTRCINDYKVYSFSSDKELVRYVDCLNGMLIAINAEKLSIKNSEFRALVNENVGFPDGIAAVLALRRLGCPQAVKIAGCELWLKILEEYSDRKSFYLIGSTQDVIGITVDKLRKRYKGIDIVGFRDGYLNSAEEFRILISDIVGRRPDIVFVAMGSPKQEFFMRDLLRAHPALYLGLGGSFDVYAGKVRRAPIWWVNHQLEWAYRLLQQPTRFWRQLKAFPLIARIVLGKV